MSKSALHPHPQASGPSATEAESLRWRVTWIAAAGGLLLTVVLTMASPAWDGAFERAVAPHAPPLNLLVGLLLGGGAGLMGLPRPRPRGLERSLHYGALTLIVAAGLTLALALWPAWRLAEVGWLLPESTTGWLLLAATAALSFALGRPPRGHRASSPYHTWFHRRILGERTFGEAVAELIPRALPLVLHMLLLLWIGLPHGALALALAPPLAFALEFAARPPTQPRKRQRHALPYVEQLAWLLLAAAPLALSIARNVDAKFAGDDSRSQLISISISLGIPCFALLVSGVRRGARFQPRVEPWMLVPWMMASSLLASLDPTSPMPYLPSLFDAASTGPFDARLNGWLVAAATLWLGARVLIDATHRAFWPVALALVLAADLADPFSAVETLPLWVTLWLAGRYCRQARLKWLSVAAFAATVAWPFASSALAMLLALWLWPLVGALPIGRATGERLRGTRRMQMVALALGTAAGAIAVALLAWIVPSHADRAAEAFATMLNPEPAIWFATADGARPRLAWFGLALLVLPTPLAVWALATLVRTPFDRHAALARLASLIAPALTAWVVWRGFAAPLALPLCGVWTLLALLTCRRAVCPGCSWNELRIHFRAWLLVGLALIAWLGTQRPVRHAPRAALAPATEVAPIPTFAPEDWRPAPPPDPAPTTEGQSRFTTSTATMTAPAGETTTDSLATSGTRNVVPGLRVRLRPVESDEGASGD